MLIVYKASAGSGKTFNLVFEYLKLIVGNPLNYRHILAVTFTNKAANEMKIRILNQLFLLSDQRESPYMEMLQDFLKLDADKIRKRAGEVLKNILHDYGRFSVNTIDSFTQRIIRAFNRETGVSPQYTLGMEDDPILREATDRLLSRIGTDNHLRKWLVEFSKEKIRDSYSHKIENDIRSLGNELFKEKFQIFFPEGKDSGYTRNNLEGLRKELQREIKLFDKELRGKGKKGVDIIAAGGFITDDFSGKSRGIANMFVKLEAGELPEITKSVKACAEDSERWYTVTSKKKREIFNIVETRLRPLLLEILKYREDNEAKYLAAKEVLSNIRVLGILADLREEIKNILHEKGILQISDSNLLLSKIIGDTDTPFIYEKTGNWFKHFILDEFQDTSALQWNNFKPLVANALAEGNSALVAGDVKQSIYRWRNSNWNILAFRINSDFPNFPPVEIPLDKNWRSRKNIIDFNNSLTGHLKQLFGEYLFSEPEEEKYKKRFAHIYSNFIQQPGSSSNEISGMVEVRLLPDEDFYESSVDILIEQVKYLQDQGIEASDTAILIRRNEEGRRIIERFLALSGEPGSDKYNFSIISGESLFLSVSKGVNMVMLTISLLVDPDDKITQTALLHFWLSWLRPQLKKSGSFLKAGNVNEKYRDEDITAENTGTLFDLELGAIIGGLKDKLLFLSPGEIVAEVCNSLGLFSLKSEIPFIQTLIDKVSEDKTTFSNDMSNLLLWWNEEGYKVSVNISRDMDAIRLLTVHKAKGLEFDAVLLPFFNWDTSWPFNKAPVLWCHTAISPFNRFPLVPVKAGKKLLKTVFSNDYIEEKAQSHIDNLNLVYVAFTRAKSALFVNCKDPCEKRDRSELPGRASSFNSLLVCALDRMAKESRYAGCWDEEEVLFRFGTLPLPAGKSEAAEPGWPEKYHYYDYRERIRLRMDSEDFIVDEGVNRSAKNRGKLIHDILAGVEQPDDFKLSCDMALAEGKINEDERKRLIAIFEEGLANPLIKDWFSGNYEVLNERNLLTGKEILRPDRIMIKGRKVTVVDYKWGEKMGKKYSGQISRYAITLKKCGFEQVDGYIWYLNLNEVDKVGVW